MAGVRPAVAVGEKMCTWGKIWVLPCLKCLFHFHTSSIIRVHLATSVLGWTSFSHRSVKALPYYFWNCVVIEKSNASLIFCVFFLSGGFGNHFFIQGAVKSVMTNLGGSLHSLCQVHSWTFQTGDSCPSVLENGIVFTRLSFLPFLPPCFLFIGFLWVGNWTAWTGPHSHFSSIIIIFKFPCLFIILYHPHFLLSKYFILTLL